MSQKISFKCCLCVYTIDNEEAINYHYLWSHNQWRGNCESPNKISIKSEADNIIRELNNIIKYHSEYRQFDRCAKLINRLDELNWARPQILYTRLGEPILNEFERDDKYHQRRIKELGADYSHSKKGATTQREMEDKEQNEIDLCKRLSNEIDEEKRIVKNMVFVKKLAREINRDVIVERTIKMISSNEYFLQESNN